MKKSAIAIAALTTVAALNIAGAAVAAPAPLNPSVASAHAALTAVKATKKAAAHKATHRSAHRTSHKKSKKTS